MLLLPQELVERFLVLRCPVFCRTGRCSNKFIQIQSLTLGTRPHNHSKTRSRCQSHFCDSKWHRRLHFESRNSTLKSAVLHSGVLFLRPELYVLSCRSDIENVLEAKVSLLVAALLSAGLRVLTMLAGTIGAMSTEIAATVAHLC